jgi:hypothetical protein
MAGAGNKLFTSGSVLTASDVNSYLMDQTIMRFTSTTTRDAAFGGAGEATLAEGMFAYTTDTNTLWLYDGSNWVNVLGSDIGNQALSNRNVIINGAMQVAQRGTSVAGFVGGDFGYRTADRFNTALSSLGTWTESIENDAPTGSGLRKSLKFLCTTADASPAAADYFIMTQSLEGQNVQQFAKGTSSAKSFAVSFWVKSNVTGTYTVNLRDIDNTRSCAASYSVSASATWEKKTIIFPADTTGAFDNDNAASLRLVFNLALGSDYSSGTLQTTWGANVDANLAVGQTNLAAAINNYWQVTGIQLEAGAVATPFEFEDIGDTLRKCQRYYFRDNAVLNYSRFGNGSAVSTTSAQIDIRLPVTMRTFFSSVDFNTLALDDGAGGLFAITTLGAVPNANGINYVSLSCTAAGLTQYRFYHLESNNTTSGYIGFSAEL